MAYAIFFSNLNIHLIFVFRKIHVSYLNFSHIKTRGVSSSSRFILQEKLISLSNLEQAKTRCPCGWQQMRLLVRKIKGDGEYDMIPLHSIDEEINVQHKRVLGFRLRIFQGIDILKLCFSSLKYGACGAEKQFNLSFANKRQKHEVIRLFKTYFSKTVRYRSI